MRGSNIVGSRGERSILTQTIRSTRSRAPSWRRLTGTTEESFCCSPVSSNGLEPDSLPPRPGWHRRRASPDQPRYRPALTHVAETRQGQMALSSFTGRVDRASG